MTLPEPRPAGTIDRFVVVPASYVFFLRGDEVLLQLRQNTGFMDDHWAAAAAGHVEKGETAYDAARREAAEEVGLTGLELEFVTAMQRTRGGEPIDERIDFFFTCRSWSGEPRIVEPAKSAALEWFPLSALPDPVVPHELAVLRGLTSGIAPYSTFGFSSPLVEEVAQQPSRNHREGYRSPMSEADPKDLQDSTPGSSGKHRAEGGMGVSSERTGPAGPGQHTTDGVRDTSTGKHADPDAPPEQSTGNVETNAEGIEPKAGYPSLDPRSDD